MRNFETDVSTALAVASPRALNNLPVDLHRHFLLSKHIWGHICSTYPSLQFDCIIHYFFVQSPWSCLCCIHLSKLVIITLHLEFWCISTHYNNYGVFSVAWPSDVVNKVRLSLVANTHCCSLFISPVEAHFVIRATTSCLKLHYVHAFTFIFKQGTLCYHDTKLQAYSLSESVHWYWQDGAEANG